MGKTADEDLINSGGNDDETSKISLEVALPIPLSDEETLYRLFSGKYIGIVDGNIIAADPSLRELQIKVKQIIPEDKECTVEYFEDEVSIYGSYF